MVLCYVSLFKRYSVSYLPVCELNLQRKCLFCDAELLRFFLCHRNVVKAFYTSGMLFDVLTTFGELSEELLQNRKYAKWKAAYIHNCLKNGETPVPGPLQEEDELGDSSLNEEENSGPRNSGLQGDYRETTGTSGIG